LKARADFAAENVKSDCTPPVGDAALLTNTANNGPASAQTNPTLEQVPPPDTAPAWSLVTSLARTPGYRWPLYRYLQAAHVAGKPCPKAQDVLDAWKLKPPAGLRVIEISGRDELEYTLDHGGLKTADLKAIQSAIKGLLV